MIDESYELAVTGITTPPDPSSAEAVDLYQFAAERVQKEWGAPAKLMTGCAFGIDTDSINYFLKVWNSIKVITLVVPAAPCNVAWVNTFLNGVHPNMPDKIIIRRMPRRNQTFAKAYMERNDYIADNADACVGFPHTGVEQLRSGTWATIRRFWNNEKPVLYCPVITG